MKKNCANSGLLRHHQEPRRRQHQEQREAGQQVQPPPRPGIARDERVHDERAAGDDQRYRTLGQRRGGQRRIDGEHPGSLVA